MDRHGKLLPFYQQLGFTAGTDRDIIRNCLREQLAAEIIGETKKAGMQVEVLLEFCKSMLERLTSVMPKVVALHELQADLRDAQQWASASVVHKLRGRVEKAERAVHYVLDRVAVIHNRVRDAFWCHFFNLDARSAQARRRSHREQMLDYADTHELRNSLSLFQIHVSRMEQLLNALKVLRHEATNVMEVCNSAIGRRVKKEFLKRSLMLHPDKMRGLKDGAVKGRSVADFSFTDLAVAHGVLRDAHQRIRYNAVRDHALWEMLYGVVEQQHEFEARGRTEMHQERVRRAQQRDMMRLESGIPDKPKMPAVRVLEPSEAAMGGPRMILMRDVVSEIHGVRKKKGKACVLVHWQTPATAAAICVEVALSSTRSWVGVATAAPPADHIVLDGLRYGNEYVLRVRAANAIAQGEPSMCVAVDVPFPGEEDEGEGEEPCPEMTAHRGKERARETRRRKEARKKARKADEGSCGEPSSAKEIQKMLKALKKGDDDALLSVVEEELEQWESGSISPAAEDAEENDNDGGEDESDDTEEMKHLIPLFLQTVVKDGQIPLTFACQSSRCCDRFVSALCRLHAATHSPAHALDEYERTALVHCVVAEDDEKLRALCEHLPPPLLLPLLRVPDADGFTAFHWAVSLNAPSAVEILCDAAGFTPGIVHTFNNAEDMLTPVGLAARGGLADLAVMLVRSRLNPNESLLSSRGAVNEQPLHLLCEAIEMTADALSNAAEAAQEEVVVRISKTLDEIREVWAEACTRLEGSESDDAVPPLPLDTALVGRVGIALLCAVNCNSLGCAQLLLEMSPVVNYTAPNGETPLAIAIRRDLPAMIDLLRSHGAVSSAEDNVLFCSTDSLDGDLLEDSEENRLRASFPLPSSSKDAPSFLTEEAEADIQSQLQEEEVASAAEVAREAAEQEAAPSEEDLSAEEREKIAAMEREAEKRIREQQERAAKEEARREQDRKAALAMESMRQKKLRQTARAVPDKEESVAPLLTLPAELIVYIMQFLHPKELTELMKTCKNLHKLADEDNTWRMLAIGNYAETLHVSPNHITDWKYVYFFQKELAELEADVEYLTKRVASVKND